MTKTFLSLQNPTEMPFSKDDITGVSLLFNQPKILRQIKSAQDMELLAFKIIPDIFTKLSSSRQSAVLQALSGCNLALNDIASNTRNKTTVVFDNIRNIKLELEGHNQDIARTQVYLMKHIHSPESQILIKNFTKETPELAQKLFPGVYNNLDSKEQAKLCQVINEYKAELREKGTSNKIWESLDIIKPHHHGRSK